MIVVIVSANSEWRLVRRLITSATPYDSPCGEWFPISEARMPVVVLNGGWGKIAAAASAQYAIDRWRPRALINIGTCGGLGDRAACGDIILARRTLVYDMSVEIGDPEEELAWYTTSIELPASFVERLPFAVREGTIVSGDRDVSRSDAAMLAERYDALAADWESASIAYVARRNGVPCVILRGVSDVVGGEHPDAYDGRDHIFHTGTENVMGTLIEALPTIVATAIELLA